MKCILPLLIVCSLVCAVMSAQIERDINKLKAQQGGEESLLSFLEGQAKEDDRVQQEEEEAKVQHHFHVHLWKKARSLLNKLKALAQEEDDAVQQEEDDGDAKAQHHFHVHLWKKARSLLNKLQAKAQE